LESELGHGSLIWRRRLFWAGLQLISDHPWWGVGLTNFPQAVAQGMSNEPSFVAHNTFINVWAEQGLPGVFAHGWLGMTAMRQSWLLSRSSTPLISKLGGGLMLSWAVFALMASTLNLCTLAMAYFVLGLGLSAAEYDTSIQELVKQPRYPHNGPLESSG
jgi:O-antigen ligase